MIRKEKMGTYSFLSFILNLLMAIYQTRDIIGGIIAKITSKLESKTKQLEEKTKQDGELVKKFQSGFERCEIETDESGDNPKLLITQRFF